MHFITYLVCCTLVVARSSLELSVHVRSVEGGRAKGLLRGDRVTETSRYSTAGSSVLPGLASLPFLCIVLSCLPRSPTIGVATPP